MDVMNAVNMIEHLQLPMMALAAMFLFVYGFCKAVFEYSDIEVIKFPFGIRISRDYQIGFEYTVTESTIYPPDDTPEWVDKDNYYATKP